MEEKKPFGAQLEAFFAGKGFYVVLFLCVAVIGVSAWSMLSGGAETESPTEVSMPVSNMDEPYVVTAKPAPTPAPVQLPAPSEKPQTSGNTHVEQKPAETAPQPVPAPAPVTEPSAPTAATYFIRPVSGEVDVAYSMDLPVWNPTMCDWRTHDGVDYTATLGTQVKAAAGGTVSAVYEDDLLGTTVLLNHGNGLESRYANLAAAPTVAVGETVSAGQVIGSVGDTALGESGQICHLHFAMAKDGESVDPADYIN